MDIAQIGPNLTPILAIAILVSAIKPFLERRMPIADPLHDATVRALAIALGLLGMAMDYVLHACAVTGSGIENALGDGLVAGVGAILTYHLVRSGVLSPAQEG